MIMVLIYLYLCCLGEHYWRLTESGVSAGYPRLISRAWPGLPANIDAAFTYKNGKTYFFKGSKYWRYNGQNIDGDYPKEISEGTVNYIYCVFVLITEDCLFKLLQIKYLMGLKEK